MKAKYTIIGLVIGITLGHIISDSLLSENTKFAQKAERKGHVISNMLMSNMYPYTYKRGYPEYLKRDFEAGADFICDEIVRIYKKDLCAVKLSEGGMQWR